MSPTTADPVAPPTPAADATPAPAPPPVTSPSTTPVPDPVDGPNDITITSTTDTEAEVLAAIEGKVPPPAPPPESAPPPPPVAPAPDAAAASEAARTLAGRKKSAIEEMRERIDRVTYEREEERRRGESHAAEAARLRAQLDAARTPAPAPGTKPGTGAGTEGPPKPTLEQFQNDDAVTDPYAAYAEALAEWTADRKTDALRAELRGELQTRDQRATQAAQAAAVDAQAMQDWNTHIARTRAFAATIPQYDAVSQAALKAIVESEEGGFEIPPILQTHIVKSETGPALFFHLVQDPTTLRRIAALPFGPMLTALGRYEAKLEAAGKLTMPTSGAPVSMPGTPTSRTADASTSPSSVAAPVSLAPAPPSLVGSSPTASTVPLAEMGYEEYRRTMNQRDRTRGRR